MFRKTIVALAATAAIAAVALPSSASAKKWGHKHGWYGAGIALGFVGAGLYASRCHTVIETRYSRRGGYWYEVPVTYC